MYRILALALLLTACDNTISPGRYVWHIGDSTSSELASRLAIGQWGERGFAFLSLGLVPGFALGRDQIYYRDRLESAKLRAGTPDWVLVQLGSNDFSGACAECPAFVDAPEELDQAIAMIVGSVPATSRILWVMPGPGVPQQWRSHLRQGLDRSPRKIDVLELPAELYIDTIHFGLGVESLDAGLSIIGQLNQLNEGTP